MGNLYRNANRTTHLGLLTEGREGGEAGNLHHMLLSVYKLFSFTQWCVVKYFLHSLDSAGEDWELWIQRPKFLGDQLLTTQS